jgi:hypothetical protein
LFAFTNTQVAKDDAPKQKFGAANRVKSGGSSNLAKERAKNFRLTKHSYKVRKKIFKSGPLRGKKKGKVKQQGHKRR